MAGLGTGPHLIFAGQARACPRECTTRPSQELNAGYRGLVPGAPWARTNNEQSAWLAAMNNRLRRYPLKYRFGSDGRFLLWSDPQRSHHALGRSKRRDERLLRAVEQIQPPHAFDLQVIWTSERGTLLADARSL